MVVLVSVLSGTELHMSQRNWSISRYRCFLTTQNAEEKNKKRGQWDSHLETATGGDA